MSRINPKTYHQTHDSLLLLSRNQLQVTPNSVKPAGAAPKLSLPLGPKSEARRSATSNNSGAGIGEIPPGANPPPPSHPKKPCLCRTHLQNPPAASQPTFITPPPAAKTPCRHPTHIHHPTTYHRPTPPSTPPKKPQLMRSLPP
ncbi:hypothetical protein RHSIM_Rhsim10G0114600 [Rhododendron simsii]|uniref:Uncharacterized protein n=1 Tax=Rhododendron simsii TaxID=118357 RepID=A0A834LCR1_RHOSS|nr:hypothetical protein RHSIM_Rhsim10G0114600 [Rhododendron simsii]